MCEVCELRDELQRISRRLTLLQEQLNHAQSGYVLAAKANDEGEMEAAKDRVRNAQEKLFAVIAEAYRNLDDQFEAMLGRDEDEEESVPRVH